MTILRLILMDLQQYFFVYYYKYLNYEEISVFSSVECISINLYALFQLLICDKFNGMKIIFNEKQHYPTVSKARSNDQFLYSYLQTGLFSFYYEQHNLKEMVLNPVWIVILYWLVFFFLSILCRSIQICSQTIIIFKKYWYGSC